MKKIIIFTFLVLFLTLSLGTKTSAIGWGIPKSHDGAIPDPGEEYKNLVNNHQAYYIGDNTKKDIYLTFDNGYEMGYTDHIIDVLDKYNIKSVFFVTGDYMKRNEALIRKMKNSGHIIGNHTYYHPNITKKTNEEILSDIKKLEDLYLTYFNEPMPKCFRPPMGEIDDKSLKLLDENGYKTYLWSLAYNDWDTSKIKGKDYAIKEVTSRLHNGAIILLHTVSIDNRDALEEIIVYALEKGYSFKSIENLG